jgi:hypothetical protein
MKSLNLKLFAKSARIAIVAALAMACFTASARAQGITIAQLAGPWQITIAGNTGCGQTSMLFSGTLNTIGTATGTLTSSSGCGMGSSIQTFTITGLTYYGSGNASLSCGPGCGWNFDIQVAADKQEFNLVDVANGGANVLAGTALSVVESTPPITVAQLAGPWQITLIGNTTCGRTSMLFSGTLNTSGAGTGTLTSTSGCTSIFSLNLPTIQTFAITALNAQGFGSATLSCGSGCGWNFDIQVAADKQEFSLVDVANGSANVLAGTAVAEVASAQPITVAQLAGPLWQMAIVGNTGCGPTSMVFSTLGLDILDTSGFLTVSNACGQSSSTQTFKITSLNAQGFGSATLSCGSGCGWTFDIQVAANKQEFNLVDVANGSANVLAGTAIAYPSPIQ